MEKGKFIVLEGIDGSGKSSQTGPLVKRLEELGAEIHRTDREGTVTVRVKDGRVGIH